MSGRAENASDVMCMRICTNLSGDKRIKKRACKFKNFQLARSAQKKQPITIEYFTVMLIVQYLFIVNLCANACCCFQWKWKYLRTFASRKNFARPLTFQWMKIGLLSFFTMYLCLIFISLISLSKKISAFVSCFMHISREGHCLYLMVNKSWINEILGRRISLVF